jgi:hypothetical protein
MEINETFFVEEVWRRTERLIQTGIWDGMDLGQARAWFRQFETVDAPLLGGFLLDSLLYRSKAQLESILGGLLSNSQLFDPTLKYDTEFLDCLRNKWHDPLVRLCPVIKVHGSPTKSGPYILRLAARSLGISESWMAWPQSLDQLKIPLKTVVLVDDFCGSGTQFSEFVRDCGVESFMSSRPDCQVFYLVAAAHKHGIKFIESNFPKIKVLSGETLTVENNFFGGSAFGTSRNQLITTELHRQYKDVIDKCKIASSIGPYGFGELALTYAFAHGTPNNSLPIYWFENEHWSPLVQR